MDKKVAAACLYFDSSFWYDCLLFLFLKRGKANGH